MLATFKLNEKVEQLNKTFASQIKLDRSLDELTEDFDVIREMSMQSTAVFGN